MFSQRHPIPYDRLHVSCFTCSIPFLFTLFTGRVSVVFCGSFATGSQRKHTNARYTSHDICATVIYTNYLYILSESSGLFAQRNMFCNLYQTQKLNFAFYTSQFGSPGRNTMYAHGIRVLQYFQAPLETSSVGAQLTQTGGVHRTKANAKLKSEQHNKYLLAHHK